MARVKNAINAHKKRRTTLERASGYRGTRSRLYAQAKQQVTHSLVYAYRDRRAKKGEFRVQEEFGGSVERVSAPDPAIAVARKCLETIPQKWTYARVDLVDWTTSPRIGELELIEPELFFRLHSPALDLMKQALA